MIGKKQLMLAGLIAVLGVAVYLNWRFTDNLKVNTEPTTQTSGHTYGEPQLAGTEVSGAKKTEDAATVLAQAKVTRRQTRDTALAKLEKLVASSDASDKEKQEALATAAQLTKDAALETEMETLIGAKGFDSVMVYCHTDQIEVLVESAKELNSDQVTQIRDVVLSKTKLSADKITISRVA